VIVFIFGTMTLSDVALTRVCVCACVRVCVHVHVCVCVCVCVLVPVYVCMCIYSCARESLCVYMYSGKIGIRNTIYCPSLLQHLHSTRFCYTRSCSLVPSTWNFWFLPPPILGALHVYVIYVSYVQIHVSVHVLSYSSFHKCTHICMKDFYSFECYRLGRCVGVYTCTYDVCIRAHITCV